MITWLLPILCVAFLLYLLWEGAAIIKLIRETHGS